MKNPFIFLFVFLLYIGSIFLLPFSKKARQLFVGITIVILIYLFLWAVFISGFAALYCWSDPACKYLN